MMVVFTAAAPHPHKTFTTSRRRHRRHQHLHGLRHAITTATTACLRVSPSAFVEIKTICLSKYAHCSYRFQTSPLLLLLAAPPFFFAFLPTWLALALVFFLCRCSKLCAVQTLPNRSSLSSRVPNLPSIAPVHRGRCRRPTVFNRTKHCLAHHLSLKTVPPVYRGRCRRPAVSR